MIEELKDNILNFHNPNKKLFNVVLEQLKIKFKPKMKCSCCGKIGGKFRFPYISSSTSICSKNCYKYYYNIGELEYYRHY